MAEVFLLEAALFVPPNRLSTVRQHNQIPYAAQERLRHRRCAEEARGDQVGAAIDDRPPRQTARQKILRLFQKLISDVQKKSRGEPAGAIGFPAGRA